MATIVRAEVRLVNLRPLTERTDAIQSFVSQETPIVTLHDSDGAVGTGYTYTIGAGGSAIVALLRDHFLPQVIGRDADVIERIWRDLLFSAHALTVGPVVSLSLAAIDTALWDLRSCRAAMPITTLLGGAHESLPMYSTEGGWLHLSTEQIVADAIEMQSIGFSGAKVKVGRPSGREDFERLAAVRTAVGDDFELMVDANQGLRADQASRRAKLFEPLDLGWIEEPLVADDVAGHARLAAGCSTPIAVGESLYSVAQFREYLEAGACSIVQVDVARIGGITPWIKVAHLAEAFGVGVAPHFLMELHVQLSCAIPNGIWVEYIPQLDPITTSRLDLRAGRAHPATTPGLGISWDWERIDAMASHDTIVLGSCDAVGSKEDQAR
ncbi:MAG: mandelate racemase/muconate lactonizing enzyme family protein [Ilumatobacteraceae bacterium]